MSIHPTAIIDPEATIGRDVTIGPYSIIGAGVVIGDRCNIDAHVVIYGPSKLGVECHIHSHTVLGDSPQLKRKAEQIGSLELGARVEIREFVTVHRGELGPTVIGNDSLIMAYCHIAHDCRLGAQSVLANCAQLAGHVVVEDSVTFGGMCGVHQFVRIGKLAMIAGGSMVTQDVPPYALVQGDRAQIRGINRIGLRRSRHSSEEITAIHQSFKHLFLRAEAPSNTDYLDTIRHFNQQSQRGICGYHHHAFLVS